MSAVAYPLTLYVDDACPLCHAEMAGLAARDGAGCLRMVDCSVEGFEDAEAAAAGHAQAQLQHRLHARDAQGRWLVGIPVFAAAYEAAGIGWFARLLRVRARCGRDQRGEHRRTGRASRDRHGIPVCAHRP